MAETVRGISVVISGDTTKLSKALEDVNKKGKEIQGELRQVERLLKFDPGNTELLAQKQQLLAQQIENTSEKLNRLKSVQQQVNEQFQRGEISEGQYRAFQREVAKTQQELQRLQDSLRETEQEQQRISTSTKQLQTLFEATGKSVDDFADELGTKLTSAIKNGTASSKQLDEAITKIGQAALGTNVDIDKMKAALASVDDGNSVTNVKKELSNLSKEAKAAEKSVGDLGVELENIAGALVAGGGIAGAIEKALDISSLNTKIDITFDVPESSKAAVKDAIRTIEAYGVDAETALEGVRRQWALNKNASDESNAAIAKGAAAIARAYAGIDFTELIQETHEVASELNISNEEALGLINSLLKIGFPPEQLDIIAEYGQQLQRAGFEAEEIQTIFAAGVETGTWNIDNLLDGLKEGRIRLAEFGQEVDKSTKELLQGTGISAKQLQEWGQAVAAGGEKGREAMQQVVKALMGVKDETKRNALGVEIFGTMWEDQGENIAETILNMNKHLGDAKNNTDNLKNTVAQIDESPAVKLQQAFQDLKTAAEPLLGIIADVISKIAEWISENPTLAATITAVASAIGIITGAMIALSPIITAIATAAGAVGLSIGAIAAPIGIAIAAIAGLIAAGIAIYQNWDEIKAKAVEIWGAIKEWFSTTLESIKQFFSNTWTGIKDFTSTTWESIKQITETVWNAIKDGVMVIITPFVDGITNIFNGMKDGLMTIFEGLKQYFSGVWELIKNIFLGAVLLIVDLVTGDFEGLKNDAKAIFENLKNALSNIWEGIKKVFSGAVDAIKGFVSTAWKNIETNTSAVFNGIKTFISNIWNGIKTIFSNTIEAIKNFVSTSWENIKSNTSIVFNTVKSTISSIWEEIKNFVSTTVTDIKNGISTGFENMKNAVSEKMTAAKQAITDIWNEAQRFLENIDLYEIGKDIIQGLIDGIGSMAGALWEKAKSIAESIKNTISDALDINSPSRVMMEIGEFVGEGLALGIENSTDVVVEASKKMAQVVENEISKIPEKIGVWTKEDFSSIDRFLLSWQKVFYDYGGTLYGDHGLFKFYEAAKTYSSDYLKKWYDSELAPRTKDLLLGQLEQNQKSLAWGMSNFLEEFQKKEQELWAEYNTALLKRVEEIKKSFGLFEQVKLKEGITGEQLKASLQSQIDAMNLYKESIQNLIERGLNEEILNQLKALGVKSAAEIAALAQMTDEELSEYVALWEEKNRLAKEAAEAELAPMKAYIVAELERLNEETEEKMKSWSEFIGKIINDITNFISDEMLYLSNDMIDAGKDVMNGLRAGMESMRTNVMATAQSIADGIKSTIQNALDIHSPSRVMRNLGKWVPIGLAEGINKHIDTVIAATKRMAQATFPNVTGYSSAGIPATATINVPKMAGAKIEQHFHFHSTAPTPSEVARKNLQVSRQLAMEWGL